MMGAYMLFLWCAVSGDTVLNCSEEKDVCSFYPEHRCERCVELDYGVTDCGEDIKTWEID